MTDLKQTNLEWRRINLNTASNKPEWITQKMGFFLQLYSKRKKTNLQIILPDKRHYVITKTYNTTKWIKKDYATLNKHNP